MEQIKKLIDYIKGLTSKQSKKKMIENAVIIVIIGVIIIIAGGTFFKSSPKKVEDDKSIEKEAVETGGKVTSADEKDETEKKIENVLTQIDGAGKVNVLITYCSGKEIIPAYDSKTNENDVQEKDSGGGTRNTRQNNAENQIVFEEGQSGTKRPIILKELQPVVKGVVVVADGADEGSVKDNLLRAVQALLDVPIHRIQVFPRKK